MSRMSPERQQRIRQHLIDTEQAGLSAYQDLMDELMATQRDLALAQDEHVEQEKDKATLTTHLECVRAELAEAHELARRWRRLAVAQQPWMPTTPMVHHPIPGMRRPGFVLPEWQARWDEYQLALEGCGGHLELAKPQSAPPGGA